MEDCEGMVVISKSRKNVIITNDIQIEKKNIIRLFDYTSDKLFYLGTAKKGSPEDSPVWTVYKVFIDASGDIIRNEKFINVKWSERLEL